MELALSKIRPGIHLTDPELDSRNTGNYSLSIQLSLAGCRFCITDPVFNKTLGIFAYFFPQAEIKDYPALEEKFTQLFRHDDLLRAKYKNVSVSLYHSLSTLVPSDLYSENARTGLFAFNLGSEYGKKNIVCDELQALQAKNLYYLPEVLESGVQTLFNDRVKIFHSSSILIRSITKQAALKEHFEITATEGKKLLFFNTFRLDSTEDFLYFVLFSMEQLQMEVKSAPVYLMGEIEQKSALYEILTGYAGAVSFMENPVRHNFTIPDHFYYTLTNQYRCV
jgi:hypothetical protein